MRITVIGGTGLIGAKVVDLLRDAGHDAVPAGLETGVNTLTGEGLREALSGADAAVDVTNSPTLEDQAVLDFFTTSTQNLLAAEAEAGVRHHVLLSIVGADRLQDAAYMRAKVLQEELAAAGPVAHSIVRATQFYEFADQLADAWTVDGQVRVGAFPMQPVAADEVATLVAEVAQGEPVDGLVELGGPEQIGADEHARRSLAARDVRDRRVVVDPAGTYFGADASGGQLTTGHRDARIGRLTWADWMKRRQ